MRVRLRQNPPAEALKWANPRSSFSPGREYLVVAVHGGIEGVVWFRVLHDDDYRENFPAMWDSRLFDVVDTTVPASWSIELKDGELIDIGPPSWQQIEYFWEDLFDREPEALGAYREVMDFMLRREPRTARPHVMVNNIAQLRHVQKPYIATLATAREDGSPHVVPVWYRYDEGVFYVLTEGSSKKARNIKRDPRVELCIDDRERAPYHTVIVRGRATITPYPGDAWRLALATHYLGEEGGRRYVESMPASPDEVLIRIDPEQITGW